ncbi:unnamed protein product [Allacma fusca]|uniref:Uncharacterized protein n=1 Tax=Allacma fusca TaxID=39272 RepID=A0A8J2KNI4_9HEXA|nr:unnamed protein product [Allacma fusca]
MKSTHINHIVFIETASSVSSEANSGTSKASVVFDSTTKRARFPESLDNSVRSTVLRGSGSFSESNLND